MFEVDAETWAEAHKMHNHICFPDALGLVRQFREVFGADVKLIWAEEGDRTIGRVPQ